MIDQQLYCDVPECDDPKNPGFPRPVAGHGKGKCSSHMKQLQRTGETKPIAEKLSLPERLIEAYGRHAEADSDEEYERTERQFLALAKSLGKQKLAQSIIAGMARARAEGKRIGRPLKSEREKVLDDFAKVEDLVSVAIAAEIAARFNRVSRRTVFRYLAVTKSSLSSPAPRPRRTG